MKEQKKNVLGQILLLNKYRDWEKCLDALEQSYTPVFSERKLWHNLVWSNKSKLLIAFVTFSEDIGFMDHVNFDFR